MFLNHLHWFTDREKGGWSSSVCALSVFVCVCVCVCVCVREREREGADYIHNANKERKARKSNGKSPHEESENHKNIRFQMQCNDIVILANKQKVKSNYRNINKLGDWNNKVLSKRFLKDELLGRRLFQI